MIDESVKVIVPSPQSDNEVATKKYVDESISSIEDMLGTKADKNKLSMPSNNAIHIAVTWTPSQSSWAWYQYTAPADGWIITNELFDDSGSTNRLFAIRVNGICITQIQKANTEYIGLFAPVKTGDIVTFSYTDLTKPAPKTFNPYFFYAMSEV